MRIQCTLSTKMQDKTLVLYVYQLYLFTKIRHKLGYVWFLNPVLLYCLVLSSCIIVPTFFRAFCNFKFSLHLVIFKLSLYALQKISQPHPLIKQVMICLASTTCEHLLKICRFTQNASLSYRGVGTGGPGPPYF